VENTLYLATIALWAIHSLALSPVLRRTRPFAAPIGACLTLLGLAMLAAGALPHVWQIPLAEAYHAVGTSLEEQPRWCSSGRRRRGSSAHVS
jgi:hypothetical protein